MNLSPTSCPLSMDIVKGKCHVFSTIHGIQKSVYCSDTAFNALKYIANENLQFNISDIASLWIDMESHEDLMIGMEQKLYLFELHAA